MWDACRSTAQVTPQSLQVMQAWEWCCEEGPGRDGTRWEGHHLTAPLRPRGVTLGEKNALVRDAIMSERLGTGQSAARTGHGKAAVRLVLPGISGDYGSAEWGRPGK